ncbi:hypothetical protein CLOM_g1617 [Closterium sp. NIES-68]|nr:hypothetical protein CLOM_g1617 [Closterium sp. NIES-68]
MRRREALGWLMRRREALVCDTPHGHMTRDVREGLCTFFGLRFRVFDTAGLEPATSASHKGQSQGQTGSGVGGRDGGDGGVGRVLGPSLLESLGEADRAAMEASILQRTAEITSYLLGQAVAVLFLVDARSGIQPADVEVADWLRRSVPKHRVVLLANKCEGLGGDSTGLLACHVAEAYSLGFGDPIPISAESGEGLEDLYAAVKGPVEERERDMEEMREERERDMEEKEREGREERIMSVSGDQWRRGREREREMREEREREREMREEREREREMREEREREREREMREEREREREREMREEREREREREMREEREREREREMREEREREREREMREEREREREREMREEREREREREREMREEGEGEGEGEGGEGEGEGEGDEGGEGREREREMREEREGSNTGISRLTKQGESAASLPDGEGSAAAVDDAAAVATALEMAAADASQAPAAEEEAEQAAAEALDIPLQLAIAGLPNVGKSTLVNSLLGAQRVLTGPEPGLTRDAVRIGITYQGKPMWLVDTAGWVKAAQARQRGRCR